MQDKQKALEALAKFAHISVNFKDLATFRLDRFGLDGVIFFQYLVYHCATVPTDRDGWYYHSTEAITAELGIKKDRLSKIVDLWAGRGESNQLWLTDAPLETKAIGVPRRTHYKIHFDRLANPDVLWSIYREDSAADRLVIARAFSSLVQGAKTKTQAKAEERLQNARKSVADALLVELAHTFSRRRGAYNKNALEHKKTRVLSGESLKVKPTHTAMAIKALADFTSDEIDNAFVVYCDELNCLGGGTPPNSGGPQVLTELPRKDILSYFLAPKNNYDLIRTFLTIHTTSYGYSPSK